MAPSPYMFFYIHLPAQGQKKSLPIGGLFYLTDCIFTKVKVMQPDTFCITFSGFFP